MRALSFFALLFFGVLGGSLAFSQQSTTGLDYGPNFVLEGQTESQVITRFFQWSIANGHVEHPLGTQYGENCGSSPDDKIIYLKGGGDGNFPPRPCTIPHDKPIFFGIISSGSYPARNQTEQEDNDCCNCRHFQRQAGFNAETAEHLRVELDGVSLGNMSPYRAWSVRCFDFFGGLALEDRPYVGYPAAVDGFWVALKPLSPGKHVLKWSGNFNNADDREIGHMNHQIEYDFLVK
jgi:hypothetical protein